MYIVNPLQETAKVNLFSTHPPTALRVQVLRAMGGRAGLSDYAAAFAAVQGGKAGALGDMTAGATDSLPARAPSAEPEPRQEGIERAREAANFVGRAGQFLFIPCTCGLNIKVPPGYRDAEVPCPRCGTRHPVPQATPAAAPTPTPAGPLSYTRQGTGWE